MKTSQKDDTRNYMIIGIAFGVGILALVIAGLFIHTNTMIWWISGFIGALLMFIAIIFALIITYQKFFK